MKNLLLSVISISVFNSCTSVKSGDATLNENIPFKEAKNYFVKNNIDATMYDPKIESQEDFDKVFGMATRMGESGKPTPIDFSKEFIVFQVEDSSTQTIELKPVSINKNGNILEIKYKKIVGKTQSSTSQAVMILIIDKKFNADINLQEI